MKGSVQFGLDSTGVTYKFVKAYVIRMRPRIAILENVPDLLQEIQLEDGTSTNDVAWIVQDLAAHDFTAIPVVTDRKDFRMQHPNKKKTNIKQSTCSQDGGSPHNGRRLWIVVYDVLPPVAAKFGIEQGFLATLHDLKVAEIMPVRDFLIDEDLLERMDPSTLERVQKNQKSSVDWRSIHEAAFMDLNLGWPPDVSVLSGKASFREREAETVWAANALFPATETDVWEFFDSNMTFERAMKYGLKEKASDKRYSEDVSEARFSDYERQEVGPKVTNPWRRQVPTMSGGCVVACRCRHGDGSLTIRRLHGLEAMRLQGWDLSFWHNDESPCCLAHSRQQSNDNLQDFAGNKWPLF